MPYFRKNKGGLILNVGSGAGVFTLPLLSLYCASKFALEGFSESLSYELASQNIIVKIVQPGGVISTNFGKRSGEEAAFDASLTDSSEQGPCSLLSASSHPHPAHNSYGLSLYRSDLSSSQADFVADLRMNEKEKAKDRARSLCLKVLSCWSAHKSPHNVKHAAPSP